MRITTLYKSNLELTVCLSLITSQPLEINDIGVNEGGLTSSQISFLSLMDKITNGAVFIINDTGCRLRVTPGTLIGGEIDHECDLNSSLGYYAMYLILLAPFCKLPIEANLYGVTNHSNSTSIECLSYGLTNILQGVIGVASMFELVVKKRGVYPGGGGHAVFKARPVQSLKPLERIKIGKIQKVRGVSWTTRINPTLGKREIDGAKNCLTKFLPDVYILNDHKKGPDAGNSPGYGITLVASTTEGVSYAIDVVCKSQEECGSVASIPEELGKEAAELLFKQIVRGGVLSSNFEPIVLAMLALGLKNASKIVLGVPSPATIQAVKDIYQFTKIRFSIDPVRPGMEGYRENCSQQILYSCIGAGVVNMNRSIR